MKKLLTLLGFVTYIFSANTVLALGGVTGLMVISNDEINVYPDGVYYDGIADYTQTSAATSTTADDVFLPAKNSIYTDTLYIGSKTVFDTIDFYVTTAGSTSRICTTPICHHYTAEYYNGETGAWETLSYTDNTNNFETVGEGTWEFEVPAAWDNGGAKTTVDGQALFWVRLYAASTTNMTSEANAREIGLRAYNVELTLENDLGSMEGLVSEDFVVSDGTSNALAGFRDMEGGVYQLALDGGLGDSNYNILVSQTGYVDEAISTGLLGSIIKSLSGELFYSHKITVVDELTGAALTPDTVTVGAVSCEISGNKAYCPLSLSEDGTSTAVSNVTVTKSGYDSKTKSLKSERDDDGDAQVSTPVSLTQTATEPVSEPDTTGYFTFTVEETDGTNLTGLSESNFTVSGGTSNVVYDFTNNGDGTYTFELVTENADNTYSISVAVSGYNSESISTGAMTTGATNTGTLELEESGTPSTDADLTINVTNEDGDAMTGLAEGNFYVSGASDNSIQSFVNNGGGAYVLSLATDNSDNSYSIMVSKDGYVSVVVSTGELTADGEKSVSLNFGYKLKVLDENGDVVSNASVKAGDYETTCEYLGVGEYGCPVPLAESSAEYKITLSGYETVYGEFNSDRNSGDDAQMSETVSLTVGESDCEANFDDIYGHWAANYIADLYCRGVVNGLDYNTFGPSNNATRAEFLKMALLNAGYDVDGASGESFSDVSSGDWYYEYVSFGVDEGFIEGYSDDTFRPNNQINRAEALVITMRIAGVDEYDVDNDWSEFDDVDDKDWYAYAVETAATEGIVEGYSDGDFKPGNNITRAEVTAISVRTYDEYYAD